MNIKFYGLILFAIIFLVGCGNSLHADIKDYKMQMKDVQSEEKKLVKYIDALALDKVDQLMGSEVTDQKKKNLQEKEQAIEEKVLPQLAVYENKMNKVKVDNPEIQEVHDIYINNFDEKKTFINNIHAYISLYNDSIESNEEILGYTQIFEKNKKTSEKYAALASENKSESKDYNKLTQTINKNNEELKTHVEELMNTSDTSKRMAFIDSKLIPLINGHIQMLNQMHMTSENTLHLRQAQLEIYYSLISYYKERKTAMQIEEKLRKLPVQTILSKAREIKTVDDKYYQTLKKLEEQN
ncbi:EMYY motif lipoprotein [Macrococcus brunensis]|uniref:EMYY motif lipoprotein n=1 Tax=Macrococcus brunensis TaxID=198483 RepID=UPI001EF0A010|nr:EMYY motif lipoprotein [Macrococcus brunensis]ULG72524.1 EMYY motif lipoprotein [Macrococcus brunensis]ULG74778.1 EMYY motif lipoprotein [Macrococcus brunensis]